MNDENEKRFKERCPHLSKLTEGQRYAAYSRLMKGLESAPNTYIYMMIADKPRSRELMFWFKYFA